MHTYGAMTATECLQCISSTNGLGEVSPVVPTMKGLRNEVVWRQTTTDAAPANHRYRVDLILYIYAPTSASSSVSHSKLSANLAACQRRRDASSLYRIHRPVWHTQSENVERNLTLHLAAAFFSGSPLLASTRKLAYHYRTLHARHYADHNMVT